MPGKNSKLVKNRPNQQGPRDQQTPIRRKISNDDDGTASTITSTPSTSGNNSDLNSARSRSPLKSIVRKTSEINTKLQTSNAKSPRPTPPKTTSGQAGSVSNLSSPSIEAKGSQSSLTKTAIGQAGSTAAKTAVKEGEVELVVLNDVTFDDMDITEQRAGGKRKREADPSPAPLPAQPPRQDSEAPERDQPTTDLDANWKVVDHKSKHNSTYKIPKSSDKPEDLRSRIPKKPDLRQQLSQNHQQRQQQNKPTYASATGRNNPPAPLQVPWSPMELRVYCTNFRQAPMDQPTWSSLQLNVMELVQNEAESEEADEQEDE